MSAKAVKKRKLEQWNVLQPREVMKVLPIDEELEEQIGVKLRNPEDGQTPYKI